MRNEPLDLRALLHPAGAYAHPRDVLRDPDLMVQTRAIEAMIKINDPTAVRDLLDILQDEHLQENARTVGAHLYRIFPKLGVRNRTELAAWTFQHPS